MKTIQQIVDKNRDTLADVDSFVTSEDYDASNDNYGLPQHVRHLIDKEISDDWTYVDIMLYLSQYFQKDSLKYVEIGVSVLKTFYQMASGLDNSNLYAFDINQINPTVEKFFTQSGENTNKDLGSVCSYTFGNNNISYYRGDVFSEENFKDFSTHIGTKANIIFSDAHHTALGLASEYVRFIDKSLDSEYLLVYDDLEDEGMRLVFKDIAQDQYKKNPQTQAFLVALNGWLGDHEHRHTIGIVSTLPLAEIFSQINLQQQQEHFQLPLKQWYDMDAGT